MCLFSRGQYTEPHIFVKKTCQTYLSRAHINTVLGTCQLILRDTSLSSYHPFLCVVRATSSCSLFPPFLLIFLKSHRNNTILKLNFDGTIISACALIVKPKIHTLHTCQLFWTPQARVRVCVLCLLTCIVSVILCRASCASEFEPSKARALLYNPSAVTSFSCSSSLQAQTNILWVNGNTCYLHVTPFFTGTKQLSWCSLTCFRIACEPFPNFVLLCSFYS